MSQHWEMVRPVFLYIAEVVWDGQYRTVDIIESETVPLIGMRLLRGYDLHIQAIEGGYVKIEALPIWFNLVSGVSI